MQYVATMFYMYFNAGMMVLCTCSLYSSNQVIQQSPEINITSMNVYIPTKMFLIIV